ncbi:MAG: DNA polymerase III subunit chi [Endozoicomonas sp.]
MTQVTFYLLENNQQTAEQFACRLVEKAWRDGLPMYIHTENENSAKTIDKLLWSWREDSFLPHTLLHAESNTSQETDTLLKLSPITIGHTTPVLQHNYLLINLSETSPSFFKQFARVCEIVVLSPDQRSVSRNKFRAYKQSGIEPEVHNIPM